MGIPDPYRPRSARPDPKVHPFEFPFGLALPVRDENAGISFGSGGMRGAFQAGVVRALVMTAYLPKTLAGTSIGSVSATILAAASELDDQRARVALVEGFAGVWLDRSPADPIWDALLGERASLRGLLDTLVDLPRDLDEVGELAKDLGGRRWWTYPCWVARLLCRLPVARTKVLPGALWRRMKTSYEQRSKDEPRAWRRLAALVRDPMAVLLPDGSLDVLQVVLDAFGMGSSLTGATLDDSPLAAFMRENIPRMSERTLGEFHRSELLIPIANVSVIDNEIGAPRLFYLRDKARLVPALRAACAFVPVFLPERAKTVFAGAELPQDYTGDDVLIDPGVLQRAPLSPVISAWKRRAPQTDRAALIVSALRGLPGTVRRDGSPQRPRRSSAEAHRGGAPGAAAPRAGRPAVRRARRVPHHAARPRGGAALVGARRAARGRLRDTLRVRRRDGDRARRPAPLRGHRGAARRGLSHGARRGLQGHPRGAAREDPRRPRRPEREGDLRAPARCARREGHPTRGGLPSAAREACLLGTMTPDQTKRPCPFAAASTKYESVRAVYDACCATAHQDAPLRDLVGRFARASPDE